MPPILLTARQLSKASYIVRLHPLTPLVKLSFAQPRTEPQMVVNTILRGERQCSFETAVGSTACSVLCNWRLVDSKTLMVQSPRGSEQRMRCCESTLQGVSVSRKRGIAFLHVISTDSYMGAVKRTPYPISYSCSSLCLSRAFYCSPLSLALSLSGR